MLFADCREYTRLTQELGIGKVAPITEEFFRASAKIITQHDGITDRLLGDGLMAFFNVPIKHDDHARRAVKTAFDIQEKVSRINAMRGNGFVLNVGIAVATGTALVTNMGSTNCNDYTMVGDTVNIASRLQGKAAGGEVLLSQDVYRAVRKGLPHSERREYRLKGILQPVVVYAVRPKDHNFSLES